MCNSRLTLAAIRLGTANNTVIAILHEIYVHQYAHHWLWITEIRLFDDILYLSSFGSLLVSLVIINLNVRKPFSKLPQLHIHSVMMNLLCFIISYVLTILYRPEPQRFGQSFEWENTQSCMVRSVHFLTPGLQWIELNDVSSVKELLLMY